MQTGAQMFTDQCGFRVTLRSRPERIISVVPSQTELLFDLGAGALVKGITKFCVHPVTALAEKTVVGGTKQFDLELIRSLKPDLIIGNKEENYREGIEFLQKQYPVWLSDINNLSDALAMIRALGELTATSQRAESIVNEIVQSFKGIGKLKSFRVLYLIWRKPWMGAASHTFIDSMLSETGLQNCLRSYQRYPQLSDVEITQLQPDIIMLSSEPYPFKEKHIDELKSISPSSQILLVDGEMFSWYGSRLRLAPAYFNSLPIARS